MQIRSLNWRGIPVWPPEWMISDQGVGEEGVLEDVRLRKDLMPGFISGSMISATPSTNMRKAGADPSVIMKLTGHKTTAMFHRYNTVDTKDAQEAYRKLEEFLYRQAHPVISGKSAAGAEEVLP